MRNQTLRKTARRGLWTVGLMAAFLAILGAAAVWSRALGAAASEARRALKAGRYAEAQEHARRWLRLRPGSGDAHYTIARAALALGQTSAFGDSLRRALAAGIDEPKRRLLRALVDFVRGRHDAAEPELLAAIASGEGPDPQIDEALARFYLESFQLRRAAQVLARWAAEAPTDPRPCLWRAEVDRRVPGHAAALTVDFQEALSRDPQSPAARLGLAEALLEQKRYDKALLEYLAYITICPHALAGHLGAGQAACALGDDVAAAQHLKRALELDPQNPTALKESAELALQRGDASGALGALDRAAALAPCEVDIHYRRSVLLARLGRRDQAVHEQAVVKRLRSEYEHLNELKEHLLQSPGDPDVEAEIGRWMLDHGHEDEGRRWVLEVVQSHPEHPVANHLLAVYYRRRGDHGLANYYRLKTRELHGDAR